jgi:hypothetical protein
LSCFTGPANSPELNPEGRLNADLKQEMGKRVSARTKTKLRQAANEHMTMLESNPATRYVSWVTYWTTVSATPLKTSQGRSNNDSINLCEKCYGAAALTLTGGTPWSLISNKMNLISSEQNVYSNK